MPCRPPLPALVCLLWLLGAVGRAEADQFQQWPTLFLVNHFDETWTGNLMIQGRFDDDLDRDQKLLIRPELGYNFSSSAQLTGGLDFFEGLAGGGLVEVRTWQQLGLSQDWGRVGITHRVRVEQRFIKGVEGVVIRQRYRLRGQQWLDQDERWLLFGSNEIFFTVNHETGGPPAGFDQNRLQVGLGYRLDKGLRLDTAHQWIAGRKRDAQVLLMTLRVDLDQLGRAE